MAFSPLPRSDLKRVYPVATTIVGIDRKNENSSAAARDMPHSCPAAIVDMDRDVPGNTAERIWPAPIHSACAEPMSSIFQVWIGLPEAPGPAFSQGALRASTIHMTMPPISNDAPIT